MQRRFFVNLYESLYRHTAYYLYKIMPFLVGDVLVAEIGYCSILHLDSSLRTHCSNCLSRCLTPVPCPSCTKVSFTFCCFKSFKIIYQVLDVIEMKICKDPP